MLFRYFIVAVGLGLASPASAADLALRRVMLSTGGVGYFEYEAEIDGAATLGLDVPLDQVDDVLMSLVVFDDAGGVGGIELPGADGAHAAFGAVPFGPDALNSALDYLNGLQGTEVEVRGPRPMTGRLLHVEQVTDAAVPPAPLSTHTRVSLLTASGLQQFVLEDAESVQVTDPALRAGIVTALDSLRRESARDLRHLTIRSDGTGHRRVRVGYVAGAPLWKTSFRMALPRDAGDGHARLQGWAVLENQSGTDWNGVELTLQSGNPVTFRQALYRSYFVHRPLVPVEVLGRILPDVDTDGRPAPGGGAAEKTESRLRGLLAAPPPPPPPPLMPMAMPAPAPPPAMAAPAEAAQTVEGAEETSFTLPSPVFLAAGHTASVPILDRSVPAVRIGLVQRGRPHPLAAVRMTNDTGASLPAGVLTLYDQGNGLSFAGDARLGGLPAGETRLLSFAEDLRTGVEWRSSQAQTIAAVTAAAGVLHVDERLRATSEITLTAPPGEARSLLVEIARQADTRLVPLSGAGASEETASAWRIPVALKAGETGHLTVAVDRTLRQQTGLVSADAVIARVLNEQGLSDAARAALSHLVDLRAAEASQIAAREKLRAQQTAVEQDENRVRQNLAAVPVTDGLHGRLVRQLDADETQFATLATQIAAADAAIAQAHKAVTDAIAALKI